MWTVVVFVVTVLVYLLYRAKNRPTGFPPGPFIWPIVGNALQIFKATPKVAFNNYVDTYGGIMSFKNFNDWTVLVSDPTLMKAGLADPLMSGRIDLLMLRERDYIIKEPNCPALGIMGTSGDVWKTQRRFTLRTLKDLGFGRNALEPIMLEELDELIQYFRQTKGEKIDVGLLFNRSIVNVLWAITMGKRYSYDDKKLATLVDKVNQMLQNFNPFHPALRIAWIKKLFPNLPIIKTTIGYMTELLKYIEDELKVYKQQMGDQVDTGCYAGAYLNELRQLKPDKDDEVALSEAHLVANIVELFFAGSETTSSTLWWAVYLLATNEEAQRSMQREMDTVVGRDNTPTLAYMDKLPYTMATIYEVQRVADLVPFAIPHKALEDVTLGGYNIPKGTSLMFNLSRSLKHPKYWKEPNKFRPEHFLTEDGKLFKPDYFLPFGSGKRVCLGESLARLEVFEFLTSLIHHFSFKLADDNVTWEESTVISRPPDFRVYAITRDNKGE